MKIRTGFVSNSSSSSFIVMTGHTKEEIREILEKILAFHNDMNGTELVYDDMFGEVREVTKKYLKSLEWYKPWLLEHHGEGLLGKWVFESARDNSIPYEYFEMLESKFDTQRIHLG